MNFEFNEEEKKFAESFQISVKRNRALLSETLKSKEKFLGHSLGN